MLPDWQGSAFYEKSAKVQKLIKEGRGQGISSQYIPWVKTHSQEFSSKGRATRVFGIKTERVHFFHSDNQYRAFLIFEYSDRVFDIREQFPLIDVKEVINDMEDLRFDKFCDKGTKEPYVITTNFLLTLKEADGTEKFVARTIKQTSELNRKITWEKLEVERRYWLSKGIDWKVITEKQLSRQLAKNILWVRETLLPGNEEDIDKEELSIVFLKYLMSNPQNPLKDVLLKFEKEEGQRKGIALFLFRYLLATKEIRVDMNKSIDLFSSINDLLLLSGGDSNEVI